MASPSAYRTRRRERDPELVAEQDEARRRARRGRARTGRRVATAAPRPEVRATRRGTERRRRARTASSARPRSRRLRPSASATASPASHSSAVGCAATTSRRCTASQTRAKAAASKSRPTTGGSSSTFAYGASGSGAPVGNTPVSAPSHRSSPARSARPTRARSARSAGLNGSPRRRPRTIRSTTPRANGTTSRTRASRTVQPLAARSPRKRLSGVWNAPPTLASSELSRASVERPSCPSRSGVETGVRVARRNRRVIGIRRRERHGRDVVAEEPSLLACRVRQSEVEQLQRRRRQRGRDADALLDTTGGGTHEDASR